MACFDKRLQSHVSATQSFRSYLLAPDAGSVTHPHPPVINQEVITAVQLLIEASSCESHSFFTFFIFRVPPPAVLVNMMVNQKIISNGATHVQNLPIYPKVKNGSSQLSLYFVWLWADSVNSLSKGRMRVEVDHPKNFFGVHSNLSCSTAH